MNTHSFRRRGLPRPPRLSSRIAFLLMLTIFAARPAAAAPPEKPLAADAAPAELTQRPPLEQPDTSRPGLALHTQAADIHFAADTQLVTIKTPLRDPRGGWPTNAHPDSFVVYENGLRQHDVNVAVEHTPISIGILLEYGGRYHTLNEIRGQDVPTAAEELLEQTGPDDTVAVWKYADRVEPVAKRSGTSDSVQHIFLSLPTPPFSELNFYDALIATLPKMQAMSGRKALVLISSGLDTFSRVSFADVLAEARSAGVPIYVINLGPLIRAALPPSASEAGPYASVNWSRAEAQLGKLARASGGRMYSPESRLDLPVVYDELMVNLRVQYVIQYKSAASANPERPRTVRVEWVDSGAEGSAPTADGARSTRARLIAEAEYVPAAKSEALTNVTMAN